MVVCPFPSFQVPIATLGIVVPIKRIRQRIVHKKSANVQRLTVIELDVLPWHLASSNCESDVERTRTAS